MIENPQVGQRACYECIGHRVIWGAIASIDSRPRLRFVPDGCQSDDWVWMHKDHLYDSPRTIAAEHRVAAQRLLDAAEKLEQENDDA